MTMNERTHFFWCRVIVCGRTDGQAVAAGMNPMDLRKGIKLATDHVVDVLSDISKPISTKEEVAQVGTISANRCGDSCDRKSHERFCMCVVSVIFVLNTSKFHFRLMWGAEVCALIDLMICWLQKLVSRCGAAGSIQGSGVHLRFDVRMFFYTLRFGWNFSGRRIESSANVWAGMLFWQVLPPRLG